jgi:DNA primase catalytic subunit
MEKQEDNHAQLTCVNREEFIENIKKWITIDSQLKTVNEKTKKMRDIKNELSEKICNYKDNNAINNTIKITDGELRFYQKKEQTPLSFGYIENCLEQILTDQTQIDFVMDYIKDNREVNIITDIKRIYHR